jgi:hypothetical protein
VDVPPTPFSPTAAPSGGGGSELASPSCFQELAESQVSDYFYDTMDVEQSNNAQLNPSVPKANSIEEILKLAKDLAKQAAHVSNIVDESTKDMRHISDSLGSVIHKLATVHIQITSVNKGNKMIKSQIALIEEKLHNMQTQINFKRKLTFAAVIASGLRPHPNTFPNITSLPYQLNQSASRGNSNTSDTNNKLVQPLYSRATSEVIVTFSDPTSLNFTADFADQALKEANSAFLKSDLKKQPFSGS